MFFLSFLSNTYLTEQYTKEQGQTVTILEETSDLDTHVLQSAEEVFESKDSISLEETELIGKDSVPEERILDVAIEGDRKIEGKEDVKKFTTGK